MKLQLTQFDWFQVFARQWPEAQRLPPKVMRLIGGYSRLMLRLWSDLFKEIYLDPLPLQNPSFHRDMTRYASILVTDVLNTAPWTEPGAVESMAALILVRLTLETHTLEMHPHPVYPKTCCWEIATWDNAWQTGNFREFRCLQHTATQWESAVANVARGIIQALFERERPFQPFLGKRAQKNTIKSEDF